MAAIAFVFVLKNRATDSLQFTSYDIRFQNVGDNLTRIIALLNGRLNRGEVAAFPSSL